MQRTVGLLVFVGALSVAACGGGEDTTTAAPNDTSFTGEGGGDFCQKARDFEKNTAGAEASTPDALRKKFSQLTTAIDDLVDEAPGEIKADAKNVGDYFRRVSDLYEKYGYDATKIPKEESDKLNNNDPATQAASSRVESYFEKVCKIDTDGDGDTDGITKDPAGDGEMPAEDEPAAVEPSETTVPE